MTYSVSNNCTKICYNRTLTVQVIIEDVVTWIFLKHSVKVMRSSRQTAPRLIIFSAYMYASHFILDVLVRRAV